FGTSCRGRDVTFNSRHERTSCSIIKESHWASMSKLCATSAIRGAQRPHDTIVHHRTHVYHRQTGPVGNKLPPLRRTSCRYGEEVSHGHNMWADPLQNSLNARVNRRVTTISSRGCPFCYYIWVPEGQSVLVSRPSSIQFLV